MGVSTHKYKIHAGMEHFMFTLGTRPTLPNKGEATFIFFLTQQFSNSYRVFNHEILTLQTV